MSNVKAGEKWWRLSNAARNVFYPLVPAVAVGCIWTLGWAQSLEYKASQDFLPAGNCSRRFAITRDGIRLLRASMIQKSTIASTDDAN